MIFTSTVGFSTANAVNNTALFLNVNAGDTGSYSLSSPRQWNDLSTAQRNGTVLGSQGLTYNNTTKALEFPGGTNSTNSLGYVDMGAGFNNFGTGLTIEFEGHFGSVNQSWERVFDFGNGAEGDNIWVGVLGVGASNRLAIEIWRDDLSPKNIAGRCITSTGLLVGNQFDKWVITLDGTTCRIYRNGTQVNTERINTVGSTLTGPSLGVAYPYLPRNVARNNNFIGRSNWGTDAAFDGALKYVRIYTEALTAQDVTNNVTSYALSYAATGSDSGVAPSNRTGNGLITLDVNSGNMTKTGHSFVGWATTSGQSAAITGSYNLAANVTLHPVWLPNTYTVTYIENGGSLVPDGSFSHGGPLTFPTNPTNTGYTFNGWFLSSTGGTSLTASQVSAGNSNIALHAQWLAASTTTIAPTTSSSPPTTAAPTTSSSPPTTSTPTEVVEQRGTISTSLKSTSTGMPTTGNSVAPMLFFASLLTLVGHLIVTRRRMAVH